MQEYFFEKVLHNGNFSLAENLLGFIEDALEEQKQGGKVSEAQPPSEADLELIR